MVTLTQAMEWLGSFASLLKKVDLDSFDRIFHEELLPLASKIVDFRSEHLSATSAATEYNSFIAGCIPIWEALHLHASLFGPLRGDPTYQSQLLQLITYVCHDPTQRRCYYQSPLLHGDAAELPGLVHLASPTSFRATLRNAVPHPPGDGILLDVPRSLWDFTTMFTDGFRWESAVANQSVIAKYKQFAAGTWSNVSQWLTQLRVVAVGCSSPSSSSLQSAVQNTTSTKLSVNESVVAILTFDPSSPSHLGDRHAAIDDNSAAAGATERTAPTTRELRRALILFSAICFKRQDTAEYGHSLVRAFEDSAWLAREVVTSSPAATSSVAGLSYAAVFGDLPLLIRIDPVPRLMVPTTADSPPLRRAALTEWLKVVRRQQHMQQRNHEGSGGNDNPARDPDPSASSHTSANEIAAKSNELASNDTRITSEENPSEIPSYVSRATEALVERTLVDVVAEARFSEDGTAPSLRDPDAWIRHLRSLAQLPTSFPSKHFTKLLFDRRKRARDSSRLHPLGPQCVDGEGRALLPRIEQLQEAFHVIRADECSARHHNGKNASAIITAQERIILDS